VAIKAVETKAAARNVTFFMVLFPLVGILTDGVSTGGYA
jgi:hypothetical protein